MFTETTKAGKQGSWRQLLTTLAANATELAHLEPLRVLLAAQLDRAVEFNAQQAGLTASKQESSKKLQEVMVEGQRLATLIRSAIKQHYGIRAEKVAEFGVQPFRGKSRKVAPASEPPTLPPPTIPATK
ncbi:MAG TPA: hypothetical protein VF173_15510 [Thermoanaerobaculia bacterium]|nr:hypothetical protein [Thermoanaerobaculia bacterium]